MIFKIMFLLIMWGLHACIKLFTFTLPSLLNPSPHSQLHIFFFYMTDWVQFVLTVYAWMWGQSLIDLLGNIPLKGNTLPPQQQSIVNSTTVKGAGSRAPPHSVLGSWLACSSVGSHCCYDLVSTLILSCARDMVSSDPPRLLALTIFLSPPVIFPKSVPFMGCYVCRGNFKLSDIPSQLHL